MRFLIRAKIPTEAGNKMVQDPNFLKKLEEYIDKVKPEASYFLPIDGHRAAAFIICSCCRRIQTFRDIR